MAFVEFTVAHIVLGEEWQVIMMYKVAGKDTAPTLPSSLGHGIDHILHYSSNSFTE
jgi:hypothetical protein